MGRRWVPFALIAACTAPAERSISQAVQCPDQVVEGIDVYAGNGTIDWAKVKAGGKDFAFIKATQGTYNKQSTFAANWSNAAAAGVVRGPYHFFDGNDDGVAQANAFLAQLGSAGGLQVGDLPPLLDLECPSSSDEATTLSTCEGFAGGSGWVPTATLVQRTFDFLTTVETATGMKPLVYTYPSWFASVAFGDATLATYPLFIASYNSCATVPAPWTTAVFWQYSGTGSAMGIGTAVDLDRFFGSAGDLQGYTLQPQQPMVDAGISTSDAGGSPAGGAGCGCQGGGSPGPLAVGAALLVIVLRRRKLAR